MKKCANKGLDIYVCLVQEVKEKEAKIDQIPVVKEFSDVFPQEILGMPPI